MNSHQEGDAPIIAREGLLRLVELVERLRARARGSEGGSSWTTQGAVAPEHGPANRQVAVRWLVVLAARRLTADLMNPVVLGPSGEVTLP